MAGLDALLADLLPSGRVIWPPGGFGERDAGDGVPVPMIGWVRVMKARVPAFDALEPGDLALVPESALALVASEPAQAAAIVELCQRAGVGAIVLIEGEDEMPRGSVGSPLDAVERAVLAAAGPSLVRAARTDVGALERAIIGYLVNRRAELDRQASMLEADLERIALDGGGLAAMVGAIAVFLGRAVALEDRRGEPLAVHVPPGVPDAGAAAAAAAAYRARPSASRRGIGRQRGVALRIALPAPGGSAGSLVLLGDRPAGELERIVAARIDALLALELSRDADVREARDATRRPDALPAAGPPWVVLLARQRGAPRMESPDDARLDTTGGGRAAREAVRRELRQLAPARRLTLRGDADSLELRLVLAAEASDADAEGLAARVASLLERTVAVSRAFDDPGERPTAEAEARATLEAVETLVHPPILARANRLGAYRLLGGLHHIPDGPRHARALLAPLLGGRPDVRREHLETLRAVLDHSGAGEAAAALGVHRNTVAYRVRRIEALTAWRLDDPELRLALGVAIRLVQID